MSGRFWRHAAILALLGLATLGARWDGWTVGDTHQALVGAPYMVQCIVELESSYEPYAVGAAGEQGVAQILPGGGQWEPFWYGDWTAVPTADRSPFNPYQAVWFLTVYGAEHGYGAWTTARYC